MLDDYDLFMRMATRLFPLPIHTSSIPSRPPSADPGNAGASKPESSYTARALPIKFYLPDGAPVVQEVIPPLLPDGESNSEVDIDAPRDTKCALLTLCRQSPDDTRRAEAIPPPPLPLDVVYPGHTDHPGGRSAARVGARVVVVLHVWRGRVVASWDPDQSGLAQCP